MSTPSLPDVPPDIAWLITMAPTRDALDAYLDPPYILLMDAPTGAHRQPFTVSHLWAARPTAPAHVQAHALTVDNERVWGWGAADVSAHDLAPLPRPGPPSDKDIEDGRWWFDGSDDEIVRKVHSAQFWAWNKHMERVDVICSTLYWALRTMLDHAQGIVRPETEDPSLLDLEPHVAPLPSYGLIDTLRRDRATAHLMLLVARHELGYIVLKVQAWLHHTQRGDNDNGAPFLTDSDWSLLSARARGHTYIRTGVVIDQAGRSHDDAPISTFEPASNVSRLYRECAQWATTVYTKALAVHPCKLPGCDRIPPQSKGTGRPQEYCCDAHRAEGQRVSRAAAKKAARARRKDEKNARQHSQHSHADVSPPLHMVEKAARKG